MQLTPIDIVELLHVRDQLQVWHWQARTAALHSAIGGLYEAWAGKVDSFVEAASKAERFSAKAVIPPMVDLTEDENGQVDAFLAGAEAWTQSNLGKRISPAEVGLQSLVADMVNILGQGRYMVSML